MVRTFDPKWLLLLALGCESATSDGPATILGDAMSSEPLDAGAVDAEALDVASDRPVDVALDVAPDAAPDAEVPRAADYCERTVDVFCPYYLRCGRMAVPDVETCRAVFLEACNARFEPHYAALEREGRLALSAEGITACAEHLETVECSQQLFDLDGPCSGVWQGLGEAGAPCGPGLESFVCASDHTCVLGLELCGTCEPAAPVGAECEPGVLRCVNVASCVEGVCVARQPPGRGCGEELPCVLGARCVEGVCQGFDVVGEGEACGQGRRCPYKAACAGGVCVATPLLGEACEPTVGCASGRCVEGRCEPLRGPGEACAEHGHCVSGICEGTCAPLPSACFQ